RVKKRFRREPVFGFESEPILRIPPIQPDGLGTATTFFRVCQTRFARYEVLEGGEKKRTKSSLGAVHRGQPAIADQGFKKTLDQIFGVLGRAPTPPHKGEKRLQIALA